MTRPSPLLAALAVVLACNSCGKQPDQPVATPAAPAPAKVSEAAAPSPSPAPAPPPAVAAAPAAQGQPAPPPAAAPGTPNYDALPDAIDIGGFGSDQPLERADQPSRGVITLGPGEFTRMTGAHWETFEWSKFKAKRWGRYQVWLTYTLNRNSLGMQFRMGDLVVKKPLPAAPVPNRYYLGDVYIAQAGDLPFSLLTPPSEGSGFAIRELSLVPTREGEEATQADDGKIVLKAGNATTWSENMRYEPKPEKNCLGFWTDPDDFAEWEFLVKKPGRYQVTVIYGCGGGNHGSAVEVKHGGQALKFTTEDTGGFQNWRPVAAGEIEIKEAGRQRLVVDPVNKVKSAVLDVQQVVLTPVS